jgi:hypothetical protein
VVTPRGAQAAHEEQAGAELARVAAAQVTYLVPHSTGIENVVLNKRVVAAQGESVDKLQARLAARQAERLKGGKVGLTIL